MSVTNHGDKLNLAAAADLSAFQHCIVKQTSDTQVNVATATTDILLGVLGNKPKSGETASVERFTAGVTFKVLLGGTVTRGQYLTVNSSSVAVGATQTTAGSQPVVHVIGRALQAGVSGDIIEVEGAPGLF